VPVHSHISLHPPVSYGPAQRTSKVRWELPVGSHPDPYLIRRMQVASVTLGRHLPLLGLAKAGRGRNASACIMRHLGFALAPVGALA
jgi:hypothetical protein